MVAGISGLTPDVPNCAPQQQLEHPAYEITRLTVSTRSHHPASLARASASVVERTVFSSWNWTNARR
jgi:hypothetical protein